MTVEIPLTRGCTAIVDDEDAERVLALGAWSALVGRNGAVYAQHGACIDGKARIVLMHRLITDAPAGVPVKHRNGDTLDNRRGNLYINTPSAQLSSVRDRVRGRSLQTATNIFDSS